MQFLSRVTLAAKMKRPFPEPRLNCLPSRQGCLGGPFFNWLNGQLHARLIGEGESLIRLQHAVDDGRGHLRGHDSPSCSSERLIEHVNWIRSWLPTSEPSSSAFV